MMAKVMPDKAAGEVIFHPLENPFMPKQALVSKKVLCDMPPRLILQGVQLKSDVWFR